VVAASTPPDVLRRAVATLDEARIERIAARAGRNLVFLDLDEVLAFEATERLHFVHSTRGRFDVDVSLLEFERAFSGAFLRVHRHWLVALSKVRSLETSSRSYCVVLEGAAGGDRAVLRAPVSRELSVQVRQRLLAGCIGLRSRREQPEALWRSPARR
jgi:DNA-binding LytR/AlgR family response regulator